MCTEVRVLEMEISSLQNLNISREASSWECLSIYLEKSTLAFIAHLRASGHLQADGHWREMYNAFYPES